MLTKPTSSPRRQVAFVYPLAIPHVTLFVRGIMDYARQHGGWSLTTSPPSLIGAGEEPLSLEDLRGWKGDGIMAAIISPSDIRLVRRLRIPVVNLASTLRDTGIPRVRPDHYAMGRLAAEHLLSCGLRRLAYYGFKDAWYSEERCRGFVQCAEQAGATCHILEVPRGTGASGNWQERTRLLVRWLKKLRPPVGLLAVQDYRARAAIEECERLGLRIPHDVAIIGIEDDPTLCDFCQPTLSSVARNSWQQGVAAAEMLDRLMDGLPVPDDVAVPPEGVVARQSTDTIAVDDPHLADALHFIHDHLDEPFGIDRVVRASSISRRQLEARFRRWLGCSPNDYLSRRRVERVKDQIVAPGKVKSHTLAATCGFSSVEQMRHVFKRITGMTPFQYRQSKTRLHTPAPTT